MKEPAVGGHTGGRNQDNQVHHSQESAVNDNFFQAMFESHQAVMLLIDPSSGSIIDANRAAVKFYKYSREELQGLRIQDINMLDPTQVRDEWMKALRDERNYFEFPHKLATGEIRQVEVYSSSFTFNNRPLLYSIIHDITEKKLAEEALRKSEEKFEIAFDSNPNAILITELETGKILEANNTFHILTGFSEEDIKGKSTLDLDYYVSAGDREKMVEILKAKGSVKNLEVRIRNSSGEILHLLYSANILKTSIGDTILTIMQDITERKHLEDERTKEHELLQIIFDSVPAMISIYDPLTNSILLNREFERVTGWTPEDTSRVNIMELAYPDPQYREEVTGLMQSPQPGFSDLKMVCKDGSVKNTLWANVVLNDGRQIGIGIDITERKKAQEELLRSRSIITTALASMTDAVYISDKNGNLIECNDAFYSFYRTTRSQVKTTEIQQYFSYFEIFLPDGTQASKEQLPVPRALKGERVSKTEYTLKRKDTNETWVGSYSFAPIMDAMGNITGSVVVARDITDRKNAETERERLIEQLASEKELLEESEQRYRAMGEAVDYGVWATDASGKVTYLSESFCNLVGKTFEELKENGWHEHLIIEQSNEVMDLWMHCVKTGEPYEHEHQIKSKNGDIRYVLARARPIRNHKGEITSWAGIHLDVTDRIKTSHQLEEQNTNLTKMNDLLEDFVHIAAHDLRSPIANLIQINEIMASRNDMESKQALFNMMLPITKRLQRTVDGLLEAVSIQTKEEELVQKLAFMDVWNDVREELGEQINNYPGTVTVDFNEIPEIYFAKMHLTSIIRNLLSNALKYSANAQNPFVHVSAKKNDGYVCLAVSDNGIGINLAKAGDNLFKPFRRFTQKAEGNGIGLYIIKNIIEKNGGSVKVLSQPNKGTTFFCYLKPYDTD